MKNKIIKSNVAFYILGIIYWITRFLSIDIIGAFVFFTELFAGLFLISFLYENALNDKDEIVKYVIIIVLNVLNFLMISHNFGDNIIFNATIFGVYIAIGIYTIYFEIKYLNLNSYEDKNKTNLKNNSISDTELTEELSKSYNSVACIGSAYFLLFLGGSISILSRRNGAGIKTIIIVVLIYLLSIYMNIRKFSFSNELNNISKKHKIIDVISYILSLLFLLIMELYIYNGSSIINFVEYIVFGIIAMPSGAVSNLMIYKYNKLEEISQLEE